MGVNLGWDFISIWLEP